MYSYAGRGKSINADCTGPAPASQPALCPSGRRRCPALLSHLHFFITLYGRRPWFSSIKLFSEYYPGHKKSRFRQFPIMFNAIHFELDWMPACLCPPSNNNESQNWPLRQLHPSAHVCRPFAAFTPQTGPFRLLMSFVILSPDPVHLRHSWWPPQGTNASSYQWIGYSVVFEMIRVAECQTGERTQSQLVNWIRQTEPNYRERVG